MIAEQSEDSVVFKNELHDFLRQDNLDLAIDNFSRNGDPGNSAVFGQNTYHTNQLGFGRILGVEGKNRFHVAVLILVAINLQREELVHVQGGNIGFLRQQLCFRVC